MIWIYRFILVEDWHKYKDEGWKKRGPGPSIGGWPGLTIRKRGIR